MRKLSGPAVFLAFLLVATAASAEAYPLTLEQRARLKEFLPRTFGVLDAQGPAYVVALGDSVTWMYAQDENNGNMLLSYLSAFCHELSREFFYPGGVKLLNPEKGMPDKLKAHLGNEIWLENLAVPGRCALDAVQRVTTDAFLNDPDLVVVNFGINDSVRGHSLESYRKALQRVVDECRAHRADVIIMAPNLIRSSPGPTGYGLTRTYATVAAEVARENKVLFCDLGRVVARSGGSIPTGAEPEALMSMFGDRLARMFDFGNPRQLPESLHPNEKTHEMMGKAFYQELLNGPPPRQFSVNGRGRFIDGEKVEVELSLRNQSDVERAGVLTALAMGQFLEPVEPYHAFTLKPGQNVSIKIPYQRIRRSKNDDVRPVHMPTEIGDSNLRLSYFLADGEGSDLYDLVTRLEPVGVVWTAQRFTNVTDSIQFLWNLVSGSDRDVRGHYVIGMGGIKSQPTEFSLPPLGLKKFQAKFPFTPPPGAARIKQPVWLEIEVDGKTFRFDREIEITRDIVLGKKVSMSRFDAYSGDEKVGAEELAPGTPGVLFRADADEQAVFFSFDFEGLEFVPVPNDESLTVDISLDARPPDQVGTFGFVDKLRIVAGVPDTSVRVEKPQLAAFGDGYNMVLDPAGFGVMLRTKSPESRRLEVKIPRQYLFRHPWNLDQPGAVMGINVNLFLNVLDTAGGQAMAPGDRRFVLTAPRLDMGASAYFRDARSLATLRLTSKDAGTWTAFLY
ncbi:MAG: SGNH/GDSL hydrolase family protein [Verrucomicrobiae bacterium]|nr:SGNH/GDSL hydrolase family protein [Verrucomicrobiae bacterium]MCP5541656.1 SGNH/GDSL hydrolase family protein [Akkermansiaceae bacterium]MCP5549301.1 SGNH/GDSL hydrolase family protein [Akkermansiaceae bacterium]